MCGRFMQTFTWDQADPFLDLTGPPLNLRLRYNMASSQEAVIVRANRDGRRRLSMLHWGLIPGWAKDPRIGHKLINARAETARTKPSFRAASASRRCLIPADGFYEWRRGGGACFRGDDLARLTQGSAARPGPCRESARRYPGRRLQARSVQRPPVVDPAQDAGSQGRQPVADRPVPRPLSVELSGIAERGSRDRCSWLSRPKPEAKRGHPRMVSRQESCIVR